MYQQLCSLEMMSILHHELTYAAGCGFVDVDVFLFNKSSYQYHLYTLIEYIILYYLWIGNDS